MGSPEDAVIQEPERFINYLLEESKQKIKSSGNQEEAVERLRSCMKRDFAQSGDERGVGFISTGVFDDSAVMSALYNEFFKDYRGTGMRPSPEVGVLKTEKKMEEELSLIQAKVFTIRQVPQSARIRMGGYSRKGYKPAKEYVRSKPKKFSDAELRMIWRNRMVKDNALIQKLHAASFPARTKSSIASMKYRLSKKPPVFLTTK